MSYQLEGLRILIIDDNAHIRQLLRTILYAVGIRAIDVAEDGVSGFDSFCRLEYDLVFTDYEMEPISGLDLADMIRTSRKSPNPYVPIIMISSYSDEERVQGARDRGVTEFLAKPFTVDVLMSRLESVIEEPRPFVRTESYFGPDRRRKQDKRYTGTPQGGPGAGQGFGSRSFRAATQRVEGKSRERRQDCRRLTIH